MALLQPTKSPAVYLTPSDNDAETEFPRSKQVVEIHSIDAPLSQRLRHDPKTSKILPPLDKPE